MGIGKASLTGRVVRRFVASGAIVVVSGTALVASNSGFSLGATTSPHHTLRQLVDMHLNAPLVGTAMTATGRGYWLVARDGGVFSLGDAMYRGGLPGRGIRVGNVIGITPTPTGHGYWVFGSDGGVFAFGDAHFYGSAAGTGLDNPIVGMTASVMGNGYWLTDSAGNVHMFGDVATAANSGATATTTDVKPAQVERNANRKALRKATRVGGRHSKKH